MKKLLLLLSSVVLSTSTLAAVAPPVTPTIIGYNVQNAAPSGTVGWTHEYTGGTITDLGNGLRNYTGGTGGTLTDGVLGHSTSTTQLFRIADNTSITVFLDDYYALKSISIFGGNINNNVPGSITRATFTNSEFNLLVTLDSTPFGERDVNDLFLFDGGSSNSTEGTGVNQFTISNITGDLAGYYSISEIQVSAVSAVPEPSTYALMLGGLGLVGFMAARRRRTA